MNKGMSHTSPSAFEKKPSLLSWNTNRILWVLAVAAAGFYLWRWHAEHVMQYWPMAFFLACPLMHLFMMREHKGH